VLVVALGWESREEVFDADRDGTMLANMYSESIKKQLALSTTRKGSTSIAALIIEPGGFVSLIAEKMSIWVHAFRVAILGTCMEQSECPTCYTVAIQPILYVSRCHHHTGLE